PDPDDWHVLAAAIRCGASVIVTFNEKDFPPEALEPFGIEAQHPDLFIDNLFDLDPATTLPFFASRASCRPRRRWEATEPSCDSGRGGSPQAGRRTSTKDWPQSAYPATVTPASPPRGPPPEEHEQEDPVRKRHLRQVHPPGHRY